MTSKSGLVGFARTHLGHETLVSWPPFLLNVQREAMKSDADRSAHKWVKDLLRNEMVNCGITYAELARRLNNVGVVEAEGALRNRIARGRFNAVFLFRCLEVIGTRSIDLTTKTTISMPKQRRTGYYCQHRGGKASRRRD